MRMNKKPVSNTPKTITLKANKPWAYHFRRAGVICKVLSSHVFIAIFLLCTVIPMVVNYQEKEAAARAFLVAVADGYKSAIAEEERAAAEAAIMAEFNDLRTTIFWEATSQDGPDYDVRTDMENIAKNVICRVESPNYPDTVHDVVNQFRIVDGNKVWQYSYKGDKRPSDTYSYNRAKWKLAGRVTHMVLMPHYDGKKLEACAENYHARYVDPKWKKRGLRECLLEPFETPKAYHFFYSEVPRADRKDCMDEAAREAALVVASTKAQELPKVGPFPKARPSQEVAGSDGVKDLILAAN